MRTMARDGLIHFLPKAINKFFKKCKAPSFGLRLGDKVDFKIYVITTWETKSCNTHIP